MKRTAVQKKRLALDCSRGAEPEAAHEAKQTQARYNEYRTALASAISTVKDMAACDLAKEKMTATRTIPKRQIV